jgi:HlyD family secretion protein
MKKLLFIMILSVMIASCSGNKNLSDGYGNFESDEVTISSEVNGKILKLNFNEGDEIQKNFELMSIDTTQLYLQKLQVIANIESIKSRTQDVGSQIDVYNKKLEILNREKNRLENLIKGGAATQKQLDDLNGEIESTQKQIIATQIKMNEGNRGTLSQIKPLDAQLKLLDDQIARAKVKAPLTGTVLSKYVEQGEFARLGLPLLKIANTRTLYLKAYIEGKMLESVKIGSTAEVLIDNKNGEMIKIPGKVTWISSQAEFTPKIVQTKEQRVNLVYAVKIMIENDGKVKIGMPGEVKFK